MESVLISACLLGVNCKYNGGANPVSEARLAALKEKYTLVPVCPESYGGLATPRPPSERVGERVLARDGTDVTAQYEKGAQAALRLAELFGCKKAILKERSPSCGRGMIYDGTFSGALTPGDGVTAALLAAHGVAVYGEGDIPRLLEEE
ncbi:MAG TPA: DUF523 domain-containing protein [Oscillospiraceae bacterium]|nr:DUF523 domain-containing protein [Oscillospiraceae bacterium]